MSMSIQRLPLVVEVLDPSTEVRGGPGKLSSLAIGRSGISSTWVSRGTGISSIRVNRGTGTLSSLASGRPAISSTQVSGGLGILSSHASGGPGIPSTQSVFYSSSLMISSMAIF